MSSCGPNIKTSRLKQRLSAIFRRQSAGMSSKTNIIDRKSDWMNGKSTLHLLPPELRAEVFKYFCMSWNGKTPNLIKALRPDEKLYGEAMEMLCCNSRYVFHKENLWSFGDMKKEAVLGIQRVEIVIKNQIMKDGLWAIGKSKNPHAILTSLIPATCSDAIHVRDVIITFSPNQWGVVCTPLIWHGGMSYHFNYFLMKFSGLQRVQLQLRGVVESRYLAREWEERFMGVVRLANSRMGVVGRLVGVTAFYEDEDSYGVWEDELRGAELRKRRRVFLDQWFWQAEEGKFLGKF